MYLLFVTALLLILSAIFFFWLSLLRQRTSGVPAGRIIYTDMGEWRKVDAPLYDPILNLVGRPDYLVENREGILPVEVKSSRNVETPYEGHILQLAAYFRLIEEEYRLKPPKGYIHYPGKTFEIRNTPALEREFEAVMVQMRNDLRLLVEENKEVSRSHNSPGRCKGCGYRSVCSQSLH